MSFCNIICSALLVVFIQAVASFADQQITGPSNFPWKRGTGYAFDHLEDFVPLRKLGCDAYLSGGD